MKQLSFILFFLVLFCGTASADRRPIVIQNGGAVGDHFELPAPADEPEVYYDSETQEIIIDGMGFVNYYDVEIATAASYVTVLTTQVNGSYDTIDISSLPQGHYIITIESPLGNTFEGNFDNYDD
jgi:hypothetical protein